MHSPNNPNGDQAENVSGMVEVDAAKLLEKLGDADGVNVGAEVVGKRLKVPEQFIYSGASSGMMSHIVCTIQGKK